MSLSPHQKAYMAYVDAFNAHSLERTLQFLHPECELVVGEQVIHQGIPALTGMYQRLFALGDKVVIDEKMNEAKIEDGEGGFLVELRVTVVRVEGGPRATSDISYFYDVSPATGIRAIVMHSIREDDDEEGGVEDLQ